MKYKHSSGSDSSSCSCSGSESGSSSYSSSSDESEEKECNEITSNIIKEEEEKYEKEKLEIQMALEEKRGRLVDVTHTLDQVRMEISGLLERQRKLERERSSLEKEIQTLISRSSRVGYDWKDASKFEWSGQVTEVARKYFGVREFRPNQREAINCLLTGNDCFVVMPTGGGKSLCYFVPAIIQRGLTVVVSPLLALMQDQLHNLRKAGVECAMITSDMSKEESSRIYDQLKQHTSLGASSNDASDANTSTNSEGISIKNKPSEKLLKLLYVTPEKVSKSKRLLSTLQRIYDEGKLSLLVVDEAHCCSHWGHSFRQDYLRLEALKRLFPKTPLAALTATATARVFEDVCDILGITGCELFRSSFNRKNLFYEVVAKPSKQKEALEQLAQTISTRFAGESGIVYCATRKEADTVAEELRRAPGRGIRAESYHSMLDPRVREALYRKWISGEVRVVVATIAFGLGINKEDVRFVIHYTVPKSVQAYYQESGRAGRDGKPAVCMVMFNPADALKQGTVACFDKNELRCLKEATAMCLNHTVCRRVVLSEYFCEAVDPSTDCGMQCDVCRSGCGVFRSQNVTWYAKAVLEILNEHIRSNDSKRMTLLMLCDAWRSRCKKDIPKTWTRDTCLEVILTLLREEVLREDFVQTPYSVVSYAVPGRCADAVINGDITDLVADVPACTAVKAETEKKGRSKGINDKEKEDPKKAKSKRKRRDDDSTDCEEEPKKKKKKKTGMTKKKEVIELDSDNEEGEEENFDEDSDDFE